MLIVPSAILSARKNGERQRDSRLLLFDVLQFKVWLLVNCYNLVHLISFSLIPSLILCINFRLYFITFISTINHGEGLHGSTPSTVNFAQNGGSSRELHADWLGVGGKELCGGRVVIRHPSLAGRFRACAHNPCRVSSQPSLLPRRILFIIHVFYWTKRGQRYSWR